MLLGIGEIAVNKRISEYIKRNSSFLKEPLIQKFLAKKLNQELLIRAICVPSEKNKIDLENSFKEYYANIRLLSFISTIIDRYSIYFDKKRRSSSNRYQLILDQPINNSSGKLTPLIDQVTCSKTLEQIAFTENVFELNALIDDAALYKALNILTPLQRNILELAYMEELTDKVIAHRLGITRQSVTKTRNKALNKIRNYIEKGCD